MDNRDALRILFKCADIYEADLMDRNLLILYVDKDHNVKTIETQFSAANFMHLTGVKFPGRRISANYFFDLCINRRLNSKMFVLSADGTTDMKLRILPTLICKDISARMVGDFSARTPLLTTEKLAGGVKGCMGFVRDRQTDYYVPNTVLNIDMRKYVSDQCRVIAILRKYKKEKVYSEIVYRNKKSDLSRLKLPAAFVMHSELYLDF